MARVGKRWVDSSEERERATGRAAANDLLEYSLIPEVI